MPPMYLNHFGLEEAAFSIAPDPRYLYLSQNHREALAHLLYGVEHSDGFVVLTGEVGAGKTTVCRCLLEQMPAHCDVALVFNPKLSVVELLATVCEEFHIELPAGNTSIKLFIDRINDYLLAAHARGRTPVLIIDEAQSLSPEVLEQIRLLTNLETNERKLLRIILLGQPQLRDVLARPELLQLSQRILARYHLDPLSRDETRIYVTHRLQVAGSPHCPFTPAALRRLYRLSGGVPRLINVLADRALLGAYVRGDTRVGRLTMAEAGREVFGQPLRPVWLRFALAGAALPVLALSLLLLPSYFHDDEARALAGPPAGARAGGAEPPSAALPQALASALSSAPAAGSPASAGLGSAVGTSAPASSGAAPPLGAAEVAPALELPAGDHADRGAGKAYQALLRRWGVALSPDDASDACRRAELLGLRCLGERGSLADLRRLDRPVVLPLRSPAGAETFIALLAWRGDQALVTEGEGERQIPLAMLAERWPGDYTVLWRLPSRYWGVIRPGSRGPVVERLASQLSVLRGQPYAGGKNTFDDELLRQVKDFQLAEGLAADGVVGPQTLIRLDKAVARVAPTLSGKAGDE